MMIDYKQITEPEYFNDVLKDINNLTDVNTLTDLLKMLSIKLTTGEVATIEAEMIKSAIQNRVKTLVHSKQKNEHSISENDTILNDHFNSLDAIDDSNSDSFDSQFNDKEHTNNQSGGHKMVLSPTSISNRTGAISILLIIAGVAITSAMYTLLWIANIAK